MTVTRSSRLRSLRPFGPDTLRAALQAEVPPWSGHRTVPRDLDGTVRQRLQSAPPGVVAREAAVLVLFYPLRRQVTLLLMRRTEYPGHHSGQIGLPGGAIEPGDVSPLAAALREAREEVGLDLARLQVLGSLEPVYVQVSNFLVYPFVAWTPARPRFRPDPGEVAELVEAPLAVLLDPATLAEETWPLLNGLQVVPFFRVGPHKVWGATARILDQLIWRLEHATQASERR